MRWYSSVLRFFNEKQLNCRIKLYSPFPSVGTECTYLLKAIIEFVSCIE